MDRGHILVVDDEASQREILQTILAGEGYAVESAASAAEALRRCREQHFDVVLSDIRMPGGDGLGLLEPLGKTDPPTLVILTTAYGSIDSAVQAMQRGAFDYLTKPLERKELLIRIDRALKQIRLVRDNRLLQQQLEDRFRVENLVGSHPRMQEALRMIHKVSPSNSTVLITGDSGTGKELVARAIHQLSPRRDRPFVAVSCAAIPETLLESELFGYERGAFTGATTRKVGLIEAAHRSTLFLDEIAEMDGEMQAKILRVLQERELRRLGGREEIRVDVRVIAATNRNLEEEITRGRFREDLYYRLKVITIEVPPLRERSTDIPELVEHFIRKFTAASGKKVEGVSTDALRLLMHYHWPGNVRQLEAVIERAVLLTEDAVIDPDDLPVEVGVPTASGPGREPSRSARGRSPFELPNEGISFEEWERTLLVQAMEKSGWVIARAAKLLGLSYRTLQYRLEKFGIRRDGPTPTGPAETPLGAGSG